MGYTTYFSGTFTIAPAVTMEHAAKLREIQDATYEGYDVETRRSGLGKSLPDGYLKWELTANGRGLEWNGAEKFYDYTEWLHWLIENFFKPNGYVLNGTVEWDGEDRNDLGHLHVADNVVKRARGSIHEPHDWNEYPAFKPGSTSRSRRW